MRSIYIIIVLFLVWCVLCAQWYLFWVKGLSAQPENINPHESALAIAEILLMILISVLIGFAMAWLLQQQTIKKKEHVIEQLRDDHAAEEASYREVSRQLEKTESTLTKAREDFRADFLALSRDNERLKTELEDSQKELDEKRRLLSEQDEEKSVMEDHLKQVELSKGKLEFELNAAKKQLTEATHAANPLAQKPSSRKTADEKDDLKLIRGIGPAIEKRLNAAGIFNYRQISEFTEGTIQKITDTIKFFPGRIERDRWVEQASKLYLDKLRKN